MFGQSDDCPMNPAYYIEDYQISIPGKGLRQMYLVRHYHSGKFDY